MPRFKKYKLQGHKSIISGPWTLQQFMLLHSTKRGATLTACISRSVRESLCTLRLQTIHHSNSFQKSRINLKSVNHHPNHIKASIFTKSYLAPLIDQQIHTARNTRTTKHTLRLREGNERTENQRPTRYLWHKFAKVWFQLRLRLDPRVWMDLQLGHLCSVRERERRDGKVVLPLTDLGRFYLCKSGILADSCMMHYQVSY